jgi:hypothetical protein
LYRELAAAYRCFAVFFDALAAGFFAGAAFFFGGAATPTVNPRVTKATTSSNQFFMNPLS